MEKPKFKKGDWCFCEFALRQVTETQDDRITEVSDGMCILGSHDLTDVCYPLEMKIKQISDNVAYWEDKFHELKNNALNHPGLNRELIKRWVELCDNRHDQQKLDKLYKSLYKFGSAVIRKIEDLRHEEIDGVNLFRQ